MMYCWGRNGVMNKSKFKLAIFTSILLSSFISTTIQARSTTVKVNVSPTKLGAKYFAMKKYGRNIRILSNRSLKSSGCRRIVVKTATGKRETLKLCRNK